LPVKTAKAVLLLRYALFNDIGSNYSSPLAMLSPFEKGIEGDLSNKISPNPSFSKRGTE